MPGFRAAAFMRCGKIWYKIKYTITPVTETYIHSGQVQRAMALVPVKLPLQRAAQGHQYQRAR